jgi:DNA-binding helix-hairpin-helix protein with protein kinase domain
VRVVIDGKSVRLDPRKVLGEGGEATVILWLEHGRRSAVKLYKSAAGERAAKVSALIDLAPELASVAALPRALVYDEASGALLGYAMPALEPGFEPVALLARDSFRGAWGLDAPRVLRLLEALRVPPAPRAASSSGT